MSEPVPPGIPSTSLQGWRPWTGRIGGLYRRLRRPLLYLLVVDIAVERAREFLWATLPHGIGLRTDSISYLWAADNLARGIGLGILDGNGRLEPMTLWPPLYPTLLALAEKLGVDGNSAARLLGALVVAGLIVLAGILFDVLAGGLLIPATALFILTRSSVFWITVMYAMSDPLFIGIALAGLLLTTAFLARPAGWKLVLAGACIALALLTRFVGGAVLAAACAALLWLQPGVPWRGRLRDCIWLGAIAMFPLLVWMARNATLSGRTTGFAPNQVPITAAEWLGFAAAFGAWGGAPVQIAEGISKIPPWAWLALASGVLLQTLFDNPGKGNPTRPGCVAAVLCALFGMCYLLLTLLSRQFVQHSIRLDEGRMLFPLFLTVLALCVFASDRLLQFLHGRSSGLGALALMVVLTVGLGLGNYYEKESYYYRVSSYTTGLGLAARKNTSADFRAALAALPADVVAFSDNRERFYFLTGRYSYQLNALDEQQVQLIESESSTHRVLIALMPGSGWPEIVLEKLPAFELLYRGPEGELFASPAPF